MAAISITESYVSRADIRPETMSGRPGNGCPGARLTSGSGDHHIDIGAGGVERRQGDAGVQEAVLLVEPGVERHAQLDPAHAIDKPDGPLRRNTCGWGTRLAPISRLNCCVDAKRRLGAL